MKLYLPPLLAFAAMAIAVEERSVNGHCTGYNATGLRNSKGICIDTGKCKSKYKSEYIIGACPYDEDNVKC